MFGQADGRFGMTMKCWEYCRNIGEKLTGLWFCFRFTYELKRLCTLVRMEIQTGTGPKYCTHDEYVQKVADARTHAHTYTLTHIHANTHTQTYANSLID